MGLLLAVMVSSSASNRTAGDLPIDKMWVNPVGMEEV
jgi:hypothetical protein